MDLHNEKAKKIGKWFALGKKSRCTSFFCWPVYLRSTHLKINGKTLSSKHEVLANNTIVHPLIDRQLHSNTETLNSITEEKNNIHENTVKNEQTKRFLNKYHKKEQVKSKRYKLNGVNLSELADQSLQFIESPLKRDVYIYNEIFSPWKYDQLRGSYFNSWFIPDDHEDDHVREKRYPKIVYKGNPECQFTADNIDEYINLKTSERYKRKLSVLENAFQRLEKDITELARLKSKTVLNSNRNKLRMDPNQDSIVVDSRMPSNIEHLDRQILEEVIRVYVPKLTARPTITILNELKNVTSNEPLIKGPMLLNLKEFLNKSATNSANLAKPTENNLVILNNKVNKTNAKG